MHYLKKPATQYIIIWNGEIIKKGRERNKSIIRRDYFKGSGGTPSGKDS